MKKKILAVLILCFGMTGCTYNGMKHDGMKHYDETSKLIAIEGEKDLYYYSTTHIIYIVFSEMSNSQGYGYMSPYYSENGKLCVYDSEAKKIIELEK